MPKEKNKPLGVQVSPRSRVAIRRDAQKVKDILSLKLGFEGAFVPIVKVVEFLDYHDLLEFSVVDDADIEGVAARLQPRNGEVPLLEVSESIYESSCLDDHFARFTLAHEVGHFFLHSNQRIPLHRAMPGKGRHVIFEDSEWQANTFAAEILMDSRLIQKDFWDENDISERCCVSGAAAIIRLKVLRSDGLIH